jgi:hypothetical protein
VKRRWPWLLIAGGLATAAGFGLAGEGIQARERQAPVDASDSTSSVVLCRLPGLPESPSLAECRAGFAVGLQVALVGAWLLKYVVWKRRDGLLRVLWTMLLVVGAGLQIQMGYLFAIDRDPEPLLWMGALSPAFLVPLVALCGCVLARDQAVTPA